MLKINRAKQPHDLNSLLNSKGNKSFAVAYVDEYGVDIVEEYLFTHSGSDQYFRLLVDLKSYGSRPKAIERLALLSESGQHPRFECREFFIRGYRYAILHSKLFISSSSNRITILTGSYNLTKNAFVRNKEHGLWVESPAHGSIGEETLKEFDALWEDTRAVRLTKERARQYATHFFSKESSGNEEKFEDPLPPPIRNENYLVSEPAPQHWLLKSNVARYTFDDLLAEKDEKCYWYGVRQASSNKRMRDNFKIGDRLLYYHSSNRARDFRGVVGTARVTGKAQPDTSAWDPNSSDYDPKSNPANPKWFMAEIRAEHVFNSRITLNDLRRKPELYNTDWGSRHYIVRISEEEFNTVLAMGSE